MEIIGRLFSLGATILGVIIFLTVVLVLTASGLLDDVANLFVDIFRFLIIDLGGLLVDIVRSLLDQLPRSPG